MARQSVDQVLLRVKALEKKGDLDAARALCRDLVAQYPANARLRQTLEKIGVARPRAAAVRLPPQADLEVLVAAFNQQQYQAAMQHAERLARVYDQSPVLYNILASSAAKLGRSEEAIKAWRRAIELDPGFVDAMNNLARLLEFEKRWTEASEVLERSLRMRPDQPVVRRRLADAELARGRHDEAMALYGQILDGAPDDVEALHGLARALLDSGDREAALSTAERALQIGGPESNRLLTKAAALNDLGRFEDAAAVYDQVIALAPGMGQAYRALGQIRRFGPDDPLPARIEAVFRDPATGVTDRCHLAFALFKIHEDRGDVRGAFDWITEANRLRRIDLPYRFEDDERLFQAIRATATDLERHALPAGATAVETVPIFIVAMPRSGTTLIEQIVSAHPMVTGGGELGYMEILGMDLATGREKPTPDALRALRKDYLARIQRRAKGRPFLTDKLPHNFQTVALILAAMPEARIVHVRRDPAAVCWSNYNHYFQATGLRYCYNLQDTVRYYGLYRELMQHWAARYGDALIELDYEALVDDPETETRALIARLGLPWDDACLSPETNDRAVRTASVRQVRKAIYSGSSKGWRKYAPFLNGAFDNLPR